MADLLARIEQFGGVPPGRVRLWPVPGTATEADSIHSEAWYGERCELVDGTLVQKASIVPIFWVMESGLGAALTAAAFHRPTRTSKGHAHWGRPLRCTPTTLRRPDIALYAARSLSGPYPGEPIADVIADLIADIHMIGNTPAEMTRRRRDYFAAHVPMVWSIRPAEHTLTVYTDPDTGVAFSPDQPVPVGNAFPGATVVLRPLFDQFVERWAARARRNSPA